MQLVLKSLNSSFHYAQERKKGKKGQKKQKSRKSRKKPEARTPVTRTARTGGTARGQNTKPLSLAREGNEKKGPAELSGRRKLLGYRTPYLRSSWMTSDPPTVLKIHTPGRQARKARRIACVWSHCCLGLGYLDKQAFRKRQCVSIWARALGRSTGDAINIPSSSGTRDNLPTWVWYSLNQVRTIGSIDSVGEDMNLIEYGFHFRIHA